MNAKTIIVLLIGTCAMMIPMFFQSKKHQIPRWKILPVSFVLTVVGVLGTYIWFFVENFWFGGRSFYGAVFLVPVAFLLFAKIIDIPYGSLMDLCAPAECVMLAIMKTQCLIDGCCKGRMFVFNGGKEFRFPSQIAELVAAFILVLVLMLMFYRKGHRGKIYPWYLILYGASRFVLNFFRDEWAQYSGGIPPLGTIWSVCAVIIGVVWIILYNKRRKAVENKVE